MFFMALNMKVNNLKLSRDILKLEEKIKRLNVKLENKKMKFQSVMSPDRMVMLAKKHNVILKDLENIEVIKHNKIKNSPIVKNEQKNH